MSRKTHGHSCNYKTSKTYKSWDCMIQRCTNPNKNSYKNYGGRGITVCTSWLNSFDSFLKDMGERPENKSLSRINNDGNYEPSNCDWATSYQQSRNKRKKQSLTSSKYKGVYWAKHAKKWRSEIRGDKKRIHLGYFTEEVKAAKAYNEAAKFYFGKDAYLNVIEEVT